MKKVLYLLTAAFLLIYGCDREELEFQDSNREMDNLTDVKWQSYHIDGVSQATFSKNASFEDFQNKPQSQVSFKSTSNHVNGLFHTVDGNKITFSSGRGNSLGVFKMSGGSNLNGIIRCATVEGNQAVIQVVITKIGEVPDGFPIDVGWTVLFLLEDNGEGANAPKDRYFNYVLFSPFDSENCDGISPTDYQSVFYGCECGAGFLDTAKKSDQIQIK
jgi:hypothetical protein